MTPTATYIAEENCLQELPKISKPTVYPEQYPIGTPQYDYYKLQHYEYHKHLATLRKIPCSPEPGFKDGEKYVEGVDYEVLSMCIGNGCYFGIDYPCEGCDKRAFPLVPVKSEDELWYKAINLIMAAHDKGLSKEDAVGVVKSQFIITKR